MEKSKNKLFLSLGSSDNLSESFASYKLSTANPDDDDFTVFYPLATEIIENLFLDCVTLCEYPFTIKKRWLLPDRPATFLPNQDVDEVVKCIATNKLDWQCCHIKYTEQPGWFKYARKSFFVRISNINQLFINRGFDDIVGIFNLIGYNPKHFKHTDSVEKMANDFTAKGEFSPSHNAISIYMHDIHTTVYITLNPMQYPVSQLIDRIRTVAEKYNKALEVNI